MGRAFILAVLMSCAICRAVSLSPGEPLTATFTSVTNTSDILFFSDFYDNLSSTGNPVFTTQLFDGPTLLATVVSPPLKMSLFLLTRLCLYPHLVTTWGYRARHML